jgi:hypothetical protein
MLESEQFEVFLHFSVYGHYLWTWCFQVTRSKSCQSL